MKLYSLTIAAALLSSAVIFSGFSGQDAMPKKKISATPPTGEQLAKIYCTMCHAYPDPNLLDKATWEKNVLPNMGWRLGIYKSGDDPYDGMDKSEVELVKAANVYSTKKLITPENWKAINDFYLKSASVNPLPPKNPLPIADSLPEFEVQDVSIGDKNGYKTSMVKFDPASSLLYIGDASNELYAISNDLEIKGAWKLDSPPVDIHFSSSGIPEILCIGSISPTEKRTGRLLSLALTDSPIVNTEMRSFEKLARPVQFNHADLNGDGKKDLIICQFGNHTGKLSWFSEGDPTKEHILKLQQGARMTQIADINGDGKPDIIALMAQAREELLLFINKGDGNFEEKSIMQFPPVYGVSYFELADFNHDGHPDILMTNGDNWDLSAIRKYYHGIRILMNDGKNNFSEKLFIPFYGASKAMAADFDGDGDLDIAAISFYDNPDKPEEAFMYLKNDGKMHFTASTSKLAGYGKWLTMDIGDINQDGKKDIFLGSFIFNAAELTKLVFNGIQSFPEILILRNKQ